MDNRTRFEQILQRIYPHSRLLRIWQPAGGVSAQVTALEIQHPNGETQRLIVRQHGPLDLQRNPHIAADEFRLLQILHRANIRVPKPVYLDLSCESFPQPVIVMEFVEGSADFQPQRVDDALAQMATTLAAIHRISAVQVDLSFLPKIGGNISSRPAQLDDSLREGEIRGAVETVGAPPQLNPLSLLHGDFWPGNLLWRDEQLVAVIDWEDAAVGDPLADLANARLEILWALGREAMHLFTQHYQATTALDFRPLSYWDLCAALRPASKLDDWGLAADVENAMRAQHDWFVTQAIANLSNLNEESHV